jgi:hypothetical protein
MYLIQIGTKYMYLCYLYLRVNKVINKLCRSMHAMACNVGQHLRDQTRLTSLHYGQRIGLVCMFLYNLETFIFLKV